MPGTLAFFKRIDPCVKRIDVKDDIDRGGATNCDHQVYSRIESVEALLTEIADPDELQMLLNRAGVALDGTSFGSNVHVSRWPDGSVWASGMLKTRKAESEGVH